jgi:hypothetical protein
METLTPNQINEKVRKGELTIPQSLQALEHWKSQGEWVPACGGTETPFLSRSGLRLLYCWQPRSGKHAYLDVNTDMFLTDEEARAALATW